MQIHHYFVIIAMAIIPSGKFPSVMRKAQIIPFLGLEVVAVIVLVALVAIAIIRHFFSKSSQ